MGAGSRKLDANISKGTVNLEIFARVLFSGNFAYAKFHENKILTNWRNHSVGYLCRSFTPLSRISTSKICVLTLFTKIKFLQKISKLTVNQMNLLMRALYLLHMCESIF